VSFGPGGAALSGVVAPTIIPVRGFVPPLPLRLVQAVALIFLATKIALLIFMQPFMDETYYFLWGQHAALSYFDHPSLIGWTQGLSAAVFGWNMAAVREPVFLTLCGDLWFLYLFSRRLGGAAWNEYFWLSAALFLSMPIMLAVTGVAIPDHLLVLCALAALYSIYVFLESYDAEAPAWRWLYAGAAAIGLAMLSKYYGILIGAAVVLAVLSSARYRGLFRSPHFYAAMALALLMQGPVLIWNVQNGFASFGFIVGGRSTVEPWWHFVGTVGYLREIAVIVSPFLIWPMLRFAIARRVTAGRPGQALVWASTLFFLAASTVTTTIIHWNALAYVGAVPFLAGYIRSRVLLELHFAYAVLILGVFAINYAVIPFGTLFHFSDQATSWGYGWDEIAAKVAALKQSSGAEFVASTDYTIASELAFALHDPGATSLSARTEAFDFWATPEARRGQSAVILADGWRSLGDDIRAQFAEVREAGSVDAMRFGQVVDHYTLYVGRGFNPWATPTP
jgi:Dolichyl-phosphate-mannose-protein mannosyltransferase